MNTFYGKITDCQGNCPCQIFISLYIKVKVTSVNVLSLIFSSNRGDVIIKLFGIFVNVIVVNAQ